MLWAVPVWRGARLEVEEAQQRASPPVAAASLARPVAGVEMRTARVRIGRADARFHFPGATRFAIAPAGVRSPDRGGAPALRVGRLVDDATLEHHLGTVLQRVVAGDRDCDPGKYQHQHG